MSVRTRLFLAALGSVGMAVVAMTVAFNLLLARNLSHNANDVARARAGAQVAALRPTKNGLATGETPDEALGESPLWVFSRGEPHDELTQLAATLDSLLDRIAASLRREQRFSAELSHELRTPVARIVAEADLALRRERTPSEYRAALEDVLRNAKEVASTIEALVAAAQQEAGLAHGTADAYEAAAKVVETCTPAAAERGVALELEPPASPVRIGVDPELAARTLQPVVENAVRYGHGRVRVAVSRNSTKVTFLVEDDGPGVTDSERERIFEAGLRGTAARNGSGDGAGLGLALARRLARAASGDVEALPSDDGGRFAVSLPKA